MKNKEQKVTPDRPGIVVNANVADFRYCTKDNQERLVAACKPITDIWYARFKEAAEKGSDEVIMAWHYYKRAYFTSSEHPADEVFRYIAFAMIVRSVMNREKVRMPTYFALELVYDQMRSEFDFYYPWQRFGIENEVFNYGRYINTLFLEYSEVQGRG